MERLKQAAAAAAQQEKMRACTFTLAFQTDYVVIQASSTMAFSSMCRSIPWSDIETAAINPLPAAIATMASLFPLREMEDSHGC